MIGIVFIKIFFSFYVIVKIINNKNILKKK